MSRTKRKTSGALVLFASVLTAGALVRAAWGEQVIRPGGDRSVSPPAVALTGPRQDTDAGPANKDGKELRLHGRVLDPDGKPFAGAKLYLGYAGPKDRTYSVRATSGEDGGFAISVPKAASDQADSDEARPQVLAVAAGHGSDWVTVGPGAEELTLRLVNDATIQGRILDPDGKPVAGAKLTVTGVSAPKGDDLTGYLDTLRTAVADPFGGINVNYAFAKNWSGPLPGQAAFQTTGADGRFQLDGAGRERVVSLHLEGPAIATTHLEVMTRAAETIADPSKRRHLYGASFDYVGVASRPIRGVVYDKDNRKPLPGVSVRSMSVEAVAVTDSEGRYELLGLPKAPRYGLTLKPAEGQLYFERSAQLQDTPGLGPLTV
jgi:hypothetical protein